MSLMRLRVLDLMLSDATLGLFGTLGGATERSGLDGMCTSSRGIWSGAGTGVRIKGLKDMTVASGEIQMRRRCTAREKVTKEEWGWRWTGAK